MSTFVLVQVIVWFFAQIIPTDLPFPVVGKDMGVQNVTSMTALGQFDEFTRQVVFSPDGNWMAVARQVQDNDFEIFVYNLNDPALVANILGRMDLFRNMEWSFDSLHLAVVGGRFTGGGVELQNVYTYTIATGINNQIYTFGNSDTFVYSEIDPGNPSLSPASVAWHPTQNLLAIAFSDRLDLYDITQPTALFTAPLTGPHEVEWSPDGKFLITRSLYNNATVLWSVP